ncbi:hypothetical protein EV187_2150 [Agromyces ramosus]|jgi:hypothetical protein|uniref:Dienelactone hydrolase family protein n=1 Tax=Agromyces ramosus TaxID=33879 RepID=A0A4Q7MED0_9MICO|nr:hypothetical protein [Agromyces ramosus]RZS66424.1 hypothetical protein EV187_2150 [Agromyces ramosus]
MTLADVGSRADVHQVVPESSHGFLDRPRTAGFDDGIEHAVRWLERW